MLPYRLRAPIYGTKLKALKVKYGDNVLEGGGPIQRAITQDLIHLRRDFLTLLIAEFANDDAEETEPSTTQQQPSTASYRHVKSGKIFGSFRSDVFDKSRVSHLYNLIPPKCDREAYSQLIYAACLSLLKQAFVSQSTSRSGVNFYDASYALFQLYTLFQTNPLPRSFEKSSLELMPVNLQSIENHKLLYRRSYAPNIRIDRYHYSLMLRLRMIALERQAGCQKECMKTQESILKSAAGSAHPESQLDWKCKCSLEQDIVEIIDRILPVLDLCEYTGPVSLEGLAGHSEYPFSCSSNGARLVESVAEPRRVEPVDLPPSSGIAAGGLSLTEELQKELNEYQTTFQSLPNLEKGTGKNGPPNISNNLQRKLDPLLSPETRESWKCLRDQLFPSLKESSGEIGTLNDGDAEQREDLDTIKNSKSIPYGDKVKDASPNVVSAPSYELVLPSNIDVTIRSYLRGAVDVLAKRNGGFLPTAQQGGGDVIEHGHSPSNVDDEVSSIGVSGISVATGRGRAALQTLLASARNPRGSHIPRVAKIPTHAVKHSAQAQTSRSTRAFLDVDFEPTPNDADESSTSDISLQDFGDDVSVVTDAIGRQAIEGSMPLPAKQRNTKATKKSPAAKRTRARNPRGNDSVATSIGPGRAALDALLDKVRIDSSENEGRKSRSRGEPKIAGLTIRAHREKKSEPSSEKTQRKRRRSTRLAGDDQSMATSVGGGHASLNTLLSTARDQPPQKAAASSRRKSSRSDKFARSIADSKTKNRVLRDRSSNDEADHSVATSVGEGRAALNELLSSVRHQSAEDSLGDSTNTPERSQNAAINPRKKHPDGNVRSKRGRSNVEDGDVSVATAVGEGKASLSALLPSVRAGLPTGASASLEEDNSIAVDDATGEAQSKIKGINHSDTEDSCGTSGDGESQSEITSVEGGRASLRFLLSKADSGS